MAIFKRTSKMLNNLRSKVSEETGSTQELSNNEDMNYLYEVSVVTPSYKGEKHIVRFLDSMKNQSLAQHLFEVIIIINGEQDSTQDLVEKFKLKNPDMNIKIPYSKLANASNARNIGVKTAEGKYITFIDDDDYVSPNFLEELYKHAAPERIVMAPMMDVDENNNINPNSNKDIVEGIINDPYTNIGRYFSFTACKLIPSSNLKRIAFDVDLTSGEDIVFFANLMTSNNFEVYMVKKESKAIYYRVLRSDSVSRKPMSFKFNVEDRLAVIKKLNDYLSKTDNADGISGLKIRINAQTTFINKYLKAHPNEYNRVLEAIHSADLEYFNMNELNRNLAQKLYISFSFLPYNDISSYFMGKRISKTGNIVDVISNNMDPMRKRDETSMKITEDYLGRNVIINSVPTLGNWKHMKNFCEKGITAIDQLVKQNNGYEEIYSYSMYPASNLLAFNYKLKHPEVKWIVEFSDQSIYENIGDIINATIDEPDVLSKLNKTLVENGFPEDSSGKIFFLNEYLAYAFADELIFQSENQKQYMLDKFPYPELMEVINKKIEVIAPPVLDCKFYSLIHQNYQLNSDIVNFAYFDSAHEKIHLEQVYSAIKTLKDNFKDKFMIHVFTNDPEGFKHSIKGLVDEGCLNINPQVNFLEFLNLTTKFDCLIVTDQKTKQTKPSNPFLPSKFYDYVGSGTDIWGISEEGSALSLQNMKYKSDMYDSQSIHDSLVHIIENHLRIKF
ncbi:glycosyl transferase family 2 [Methanobacterium lacus]|uniref:Glycosyl transferase family 2 n=1 Tax=Methanobacterium lacus (strain AL-21) TaxID=877455 RepID=F0TC12_METLA|nr:glycosyltransferase [Methanobacterium lacus]ADZ09163.1 glycosyl transferase family 2 [Methanobacterium lacus]